MSYLNKDGIDTAVGNNGVAPSAEGEISASTLPVENNNTPAQEAKPAEALPESVSDRTKREFDKLTERNRTLSEELRKLRTSIPETSQPQVSPKNYLDEDGNVDIDRLNKDLNTAVVHSQRALEIAEKQREQAEEKEAYKFHPWLNPNDPSFNKDAYEAVVDRLVRRKFVDKEDVSLTQIAQDVERFYKPNQSTPQQAVEEYKQSEQQKNLTSPNSAGVGQPRDSFTTDELRRRTQEGDSEAIRERLKRAGII